MNTPTDGSNADVAPPKNNTISALPGEAGIPNVAAPSQFSVSKKGLVAVGLLVISLVAVAAFSVQRFVGSGKKADAAESKKAGDRPTAASAEPRKLEMPVLTAVGTAHAAGAAPANASAATRIPELIPTSAEAAEPIGVRRSGQAAPGGATKTIAPEDAPVLLASSRPGATTSTATAPVRRADPSIAPNDSAALEASDSDDTIAATSLNLQGYQQQLHGLLDKLTQTATAAMGQAGGGAAGAAPGGPPLAATGFAPPMLGGATTSGAPTSSKLFGGTLQGSATPRVMATMLIHRSLTLPKGTAFTCALKTKVISATSGMVGCQVQRNVFSDDGRVLLIERGSHMDGEYRIGSVRPGMVRIPVLWTRIRTPHGVTVDIESPGTGPLGESGIDGFVDNRWFERIGAAMLLSVIDDAVKLVVQNESGSAGGQGNTLVLPSTTGNASKLAEKVLDSTINIPPLIYQNQGGIVGIYVARDVDFSAVYELKPDARTAGVAKANPDAEVVK
jgi:type IV secretion system protein VirB10